MMNLDKLNAAGEKITAELVRIRESVGGKLAIIEITGVELEKRARNNPGKPIIISSKLHLAYIKDHGNIRYYGKAMRAAKTAENGCYYGGNKLHFYYCEKLQEMTHQGRQRRYRQTSAIDSTQTVDLPEEKNRQIRLAWCQYCIREFQDDGWDALGAVVNREWLDGVPGQITKSGDAETLKQFFRPSNPLWKKFVAGLDSPAAPSDYPSDWSAISEDFRKKKNYTCGVCGVCCTEYVWLTDAHHINGVKSDCDDKNLHCLCVYHHSQQPMHGHYKPKEYDMRFLRRLWEEQNIPAELRERPR